MAKYRSEGDAVDWRRRRAEITRAAMPLYLERPWPSVPLEEICERAGISYWQVYYSFDGQEDIYRAAVTALIDALADMVAAAPGADPTVSRTIQCHVRHAAAAVHSKAYRDLLFLCLRDAHAEPWIATAYEHRIAEPLRKGLEDAVTESGARNGMTLVMLHGVRERYLAMLEATLAIPKLLPRPDCVAPDPEQAIAETCKLVTSSTCTFDGFGVDTVSQSAAAAA